MGDVRYERHLEHVLAHGTDHMGEMDDAELIQALAALAARGPEDFLANVLATEIMNRLDRAHAAVMHADDGIVALDLEGAGVFVNPAAERILGWRRRDLRGVHLHSLVHDDADADCPLDAAIEDPAAHPRLRTRLVRRDGTVVMADLRVSPVRREGMTSGVVVALREVGTS